MDHEASTLCTTSLLEDTKQDSKTETQPENQEVENPESISGTKTDN